LFNKESKRKRPFLVTLLAIVVLSITTIHLVRLIQAINWWDFLSQLPGVSPGYLAVTGLIGTLLGLPLFWGLWRGHPIVPAAARSLAVLYGLYWWLEKLFTAQSAGNLINWPFSAAFSIVLLSITFLTFLRPEVKAYFGVSYERSTQDSGITRPES
jgi:hypothetical protein